MRPDAHAVLRTMCSLHEHPRRQTFACYLHRLHGSRPMFTPTGSYLSEELLQWMLERGLLRMKEHLVPLVIQPDQTEHYVPTAKAFALCPARAGEGRSMASAAVWRVIPR